MRDGGATVFARVDHGAGAAGAGLELADSQLLVFGNPKVGTLPQQADIEVGLVLPMRVLIYRGRAGTVIAYVPPKELFAGFDVPPDADYVDRIDTVLKTLVDRAAR